MPKHCQRLRLHVVSVDDNDAELDEWLDDLGRDGIEVAPDGDEGFTQ